MASSVTQTALVAAIPDTTATTTPATTSNTNVATPSAIPQDTVTLSPQAQSITVGAAGAAPPDAIAGASASAILQEVQQLETEGLSANQIAEALNLPLSTVLQYSVNAPPPLATAAAA